MNFAVPTLCLSQTSAQVSKNTALSCNWRVSAQKKIKNRTKVQCLHTKLDKQQEQLLLVLVCLFVRFCVRTTLFAYICCRIRLMQMNSRTAEKESKQTVHSFVFIAISFFAICSAHAVTEL